MTGLNAQLKFLPLSDEASKSEEEREAERKEKAKQRRSRTNFSLEQVLELWIWMWIDVLDGCGSGCGQLSWMAVDVGRWLGWILSFRF